MVTKTKNWNRKIREDIVKILRKVDIFRYEALEGTIERPPQPIFGDISTNVCFSLSRKLKQSPQKLAEDGVSKIVIPPTCLITKVESSGGYINFHFDYEKLAVLAMKTIIDLDNEYGSSDVGKDKKTIVEFPSITILPLLMVLALLASFIQKKTKDVA